MLCNKHVLLKINLVWFVWQLKARHIEHKYFILCQNRERDQLRRLSEDSERETIQEFHQSNFTEYHQ